jgi:hypothetical protein
MGFPNWAPRNVQPDEPSDVGSPMTRQSRVSLRLPGLRYQFRDIRKKRPPDGGRCKSDSVDPIDQVSENASPGS